MGTGQGQGDEVQGDIDLFEWLGNHLDFRVQGYRTTVMRTLPEVRDWTGELLERRSIESGATLRELMIRSLLKIRSKSGGRLFLEPNRAQTEYEARATKRNVVLKARQLGITTYIAARFFIHTITHPGTLSVQVAHNQEAAEDLFKIVHRFAENLPQALQRGALRTSRANVRQIVFPRLDSEYRVAAADENAGRGLTIHNLHCSEVARWTRGAEEALASLRAAVVPEGEIVLEGDFKAGLSKVIDGTVQCLNASSWSKAK